MADNFAPPAGPPPPRAPEVPQGWKAVWNEQYKEWFYVNLHTKQSQWDKPTEPIYPPPGSDNHGPPGYDHSSSHPVGPEKGGLQPQGTGEHLFSGGATTSHQPDVSADEAYARKLQEEENARNAGPQRGSADGYYNQSAPQYGQQSGQGQYGGGPAPYNSNQIPQGQQTSPSGKSKGGFLGKLLGKAKMAGGSSSQGGYPQQGYGQQQYAAPQQGYYGGGYGAGGGLPMGGGMMGRPARKPGMGLPIAAGVGGGLLGGMMLGSALDGGDGGGYGGDDGGYGGDDGGGDFGGDGGGDFGGGDGGGGDFGGGD